MTAARRSVPEAAELARARFEAVLSRCRRSIAVFDSGKPRNAASRGVHNFLGNEGIAPFELRARGQKELAQYGVDVIESRVEDVQVIPPTHHATRFRADLEHGSSIVTRKLLLATGIRDILPGIPGLQECYGRSVHHCPYCDGWEHRDQRLAVLGEPDEHIGMAILMRCWSSQVTLFTNGVKLSQDQSSRLVRNAIDYREQPVRELVHTGGALQAVVLVDASAIQAQAIFVKTNHIQHFEYLSRLRGEQEREVPTSNKQRSKVDDLFVAGDAEGEVQFAIVAAAEGAIAAVAINRELIEEDESRM